MDATTIRTTARPASGRTILAALALLAALLAAQAAGAQPKGGQNQKNHEQRAADYAEGCKNSGGTPQVLKSKDPKMSVVRCLYEDYAKTCAFKDSYPENIDVCADSRGITAPPTPTRPETPGDLPDSAVQDEATPVATTAHAGTRAAPGGESILAADDDEQP